MQEEIFGPVLPIIKYSHINEGLLFYYYYYYYYYYIIIFIIIIIIISINLLEMTILKIYE
jgi:hypothetical protein